MGCWTDCPRELLYGLFSDKLLLGRKDLYNLCLVCKSWSPIAIECLEKRPVVIPFYGKHLPRFLRALLTRETSQTRITHLTFDWPEWPDYSDEEGRVSTHFTWTAEEEGKLRALAERYDIQQEMLNELLEKKFRDLMLLAIICLLPELQYLDLSRIDAIKQGYDDGRDEDDDEYETNFEDEVFRFDTHLDNIISAQLEQEKPNAAKINWPAGIIKLKEYRMTSVPETGFPASVIVPAFLFPNIENIYGIGLNSELEVDRLANFAPFKSSVKKIKLCGCFETSEICSLIRQCERLEYFQIHWNENYDDEKVEWDPGVVGNALNECHKDSLKTTIVQEGCGGDSSDEDHYPGNDEQQSSDEEYSELEDDDEQIYA